jgi:hypothetical protein
MAHHLEIRVAEEMRDVLLAAGEVIVEADDVVAARDERVAEMRAEEAGGAGDKGALAGEVVEGALPAAATASAGSISLRPSET